MVGDIELTGNALELPGDDLTLIAYTADAGSPAEDQLRLLASWAATQHAAPHDAASRQSADTATTDHRPDLPSRPPTSATAERNETHHA